MLVIKLFKNTKRSLRAKTAKKESDYPPLDF